MCQEHKFMYCPKCKSYEANQQFDPIENIQKFMDYIKKEQQKLRKTKRQENQGFQNMNIKKHRRHELLPDDSASEITYLEEEEILSKYIDTNMTEAMRKKKQRTQTQKRLYGENLKEAEQEHVCQKRSKKRAKSGNKKLKVELRLVESPQSMHDESNSAHQFSQYDISVQADSEARCEVQMQTSAIEFKSVVNQTSKQDHHSIVQQTSEIEYKSNNMQTSLFGPNAQRAEFSCQTDPKLTTIRLVMKQKQIQTQKLIDIAKDDWVKSSVYKRAMRNEAQKKNINYNQMNISTDDYDENEIEQQSTSQFIDNKSLNVSPQKIKHVNNEKFDYQNAQDPDTDITLAERQQQYQHSGLGFLKNYWEKGNIQILTQTELQYVKQLLKQKNHELWKQQTTLNDLQRHCKYTIRKLTQQMANLDNSTIFRNLKQPSRQQTLYLVYRAELLFQALQESEKIFKLLAKIIFDQSKFKSIYKYGAFNKEDVQFINEREIQYRRIMTQVNSFQQSYKLFHDFIFQNEPFNEFLQRQLQKVIKCKKKLQNLQNDQDLQNQEQIQEDQSEKSSNYNPLIDIQNQLMEQNQDKNVKGQNSEKDKNISQVGYQNEYENIQTSQNLQIEDLKISSYQTAEMDSIKYENQNQQIGKTIDALQYQQKILVKADIPKKQLSLNFNKDNEQDLVGKDTLDMINMQVERDQDIAVNKSVANIQNHQFTINNLHPNQNILKTPSLHSQHPQQFNQQQYRTPKTVENYLFLPINDNLDIHHNQNNVFSDQTKIIGEILSDYQNATEARQDNQRNFQNNEQGFRGSFGQYQSNHGENQKANLILTPEMIQEDLKIKKEELIKNIIQSD